MPIPGGWELIVILGVLVLLFGAKKLPDMARSVGQSARVFKGEMKALKDTVDEDVPATPAPAISTPMPPAPVVTAPVVVAPVPVEK